MKRNLINKFLFSFIAFLHPFTTGSSLFAEEPLNPPFVQPTNVKEDSITIEGRTALYSSGWVRDSVIYEVYLRAFSRRSKLNDLESRLSKLKNLGVTCISLMPIYPIGEVDRMGSMGNPYRVMDHSLINLENGTIDILKTLVTEVHYIGMKIILDWVPSHTSRDHPFVISNPEWYMRDKEGNIVEDSEGLKLNYSSIDLQRKMILTMIQWIKETEIDGFRIHNADLVPIEFWFNARRQLLKVKPSIVLFGDGDLPDYQRFAFNGTYSKGFYKTLSKIVSGNIGADQLEDYLVNEESKYPIGALQIRYLETHDLPRASNQFGPASNPLAVLLTTLNGIPMIYNGQEIGEIRQPSLVDQEAIDWENGLKRSPHTMKLYKKLFRLRARRDSLSRGQRFSVKNSHPEAVFSFARSYRDDAVLVAVNLSSKNFDGTINIPEIFQSEKGKLKLKTVFPDAQLSINGPTAHLKLPPWGYQVWLSK